MNHPGRTLLVFGAYLALLGVVLLLVPNSLLGAFGLPAAEDVWIRVVGMLTLFLAAYYYVAARHGLTAFIRWSVPVRASVVVFFGAFVLLKLAPPVLLMFGAVDLVGALWTHRALRAQER